MTEYYNEMNSKFEEAQILLYSMLGNVDLVNQWWNTPNKGFDDKRPNEIWEKNPDRVLKYLNLCAYGGW